MRLISSRKSLAALAALTLGVTGLTIAAEMPKARWGSPGAAGIPSTAYADDVLTTSSRLTMPSNSGTFARVYFPVTADALGSSDIVTLKCRFIDNGADDRVQLYLKEYRPSNGATYTRLVADSNSKAGSSGAQVMTSSQQYPGWTLDDPDSVFFIEARLSRYGSTRPSIYSVSLHGGSF